MDLKNDKEEFIRCFPAVSLRFIFVSAAPQAWWAAPISQAQDGFSVDACALVLALQVLVLLWGFFYALVERYGEKQLIYIYI